MYNPIYIACQYFLSKDYIAKVPRIKNLFICAQNGIKKLMETYKSCSILNLTLCYYYAILTNHIDQQYNDNIFYKDGFTYYYTNEIITNLNKQWTEEKIKVILDLISFLIKCNEQSNNIKSVENIMINIDKSSQELLSTFF
jgi:hypothetical protein